MCDFWKDGSAFDDGWRLLCDTEFEYEDFENITHLWISHEHPDHFSPPNLKSIPEEFRNKITVLFQRTLDKRVVSFCRKLNFANVIEMAPYDPIEITTNVELICAPYGASFADVDSWLCVKTPSTTLLNINDCELEAGAEINRINDACGRIDFLTTQFSFASRQGNRDDPTWVAKAQKYHLERLGLKIEAFRPRYTLPFASFVYWSHIENRYLNDGAIKVHDAAELIEKRSSTPIVMYPQDAWAVGEEWNNKAALDRYAERYDWVASAPDSEFSTTDAIEQPALFDQSMQFLIKMSQDVSSQQIKKYIALQHADIRNKASSSGLKRRLDALWSGLTGRYEHSRIYVEDHEQAYSFSLDNGLIPADFGRQQCHISITSEALNFCFSVPFGGESLQINGRFQEISEHGWQYLNRIFFLARKIDQKVALPKYVLLNAILISIGLASYVAFE